MSEVFSFDTHDRLNRKNFAEQLTNVVLQSEKLVGGGGSLVIGLNSPWGTGKSTFVEMWGNLLRGNHGDDIEVVTYNGWINDDWNNSLVPLVNSLISQFTFESKVADIEKQFKEKAIKLTKHIGKGLALHAFKQYSGIDLLELNKAFRDVGINSNDAFHKLMEKESENNLFKEFKEYEDVKEQFKKSLRELSEHKKIVFFIDELDRCRPTFAIETLEIIKHFFDIENIVFIVSIDMEQLSHSISTIYGEKMDSSGYLRRFFNFQFNIPTPSVPEYLKFLLEENNIEIDSSLIDRLENLLTRLNLTLRDINSIMSNINLLNKTVFKGKHLGNDFLEIYYYLLILKYKYPSEYDAILRGRISRMDSVQKGPVRLDHKFYVGNNISKFLTNVEETALSQSIKFHLNDDGKNAFSTEDIKIQNPKLFFENTKFLSIIDQEDLINNPKNIELTYGQYIERKLELFN